MKAIEQYFPVKVFIIMVVLSFDYDIKMKAISFVRSTQGFITVDILSGGLQ